MPMGEARGGMCDCLRVDGGGGGEERMCGFWLQVSCLLSLLVQKWDTVVESVWGGEGI